MNICKKYMMKLDRDFYLQDTLTVAKQLLGKYIVREIDGVRLSVKITETEAYIGSIDKACHCYGEKITPRTKIMYYMGGYAYVYLIYGMYYCLNVVTEKQGNGCAVLIRGAEPVNELEYMSNLRYNKPYNELSAYQLNNFANGPGKLCKALNITKELNEQDLLGNTLYITEGEKVTQFNVGKRINIDYAQEAKDFLWRFYL